MEKEINIDEILERNHITLENTMRDGLIKKAIKEILTETLQMCADEATLKNESMYQGCNGNEDGFLYADEIVIDKESITSLINKIKF